MTVGDRIKQRRIELNLSQEELAIKLGYSSRNAIYRYEKSDNIKLSTVEKFADALNTSPACLMGWIDEESRAKKNARLIASFEKLTEQEQQNVMLFVDALLQSRYRYF